MLIIKKETLIVSYNKFGYELIIKKIETYQPKAGTLGGSFPRQAF